MAVIKSSEWLQILNNLEGLPEFAAYATTLASALTLELGVDEGSTVLLEPLSEDQREEQWRGFYDYFLDLPEDWSYSTEEELRSAFDKCILFKATDEPYITLWADDNRKSRGARALIKEDAVKARQKRNSENFRELIYLVEAQRKKRQAKEKSESLHALRLGYSQPASEYINKYS